MNCNCCIDTVTFTLCSIDRQWQHVASASVNAKPKNFFRFFGCASTASATRFVLLSFSCCQRYGTYWIFCVPENNHKFSHIIHCENCILLYFLYSIHLGEFKQNVWYRSVSWFSVIFLEQIGTAKRYTFRAIHVIGYTANTHFEHILSLCAIPR